MHVLVPGGTGFIGTALCRELVDRDHEVVALARNPSEAALPPGVTAVAGDVTEPASLTDPVGEADAIIYLVALSPLFKTPKGLTHEGIHRDGTAHLLDAAADADVDRFVQMSGLGADPNANTAYLRAKGEAEELVRESDLGWTIFRPSVVFGDGSEFLRFSRWLSFPPMTHTIAWPYITPLPGGGSTRFQPIFVDELVEMMASCLEDDVHIGQTYELGGPETLSLARIIRAIHAADGKPARILWMPMSLAKIGLTIAGIIPWFPMGAEQAKSLDFENVPESNDVGAFGREASDLTPIKEYLEGHHT